MTGVQTCALPISLGSLGVTSYSHAYNYIVETADLVVFLGAGFNERTSYLWDNKLLSGKKIAQVDNDYEQLEKVFKADVAINGDIKSVLNAVLNNLQARGIERKKISLDDQVRNLKNKSSENDSAEFRSRFPLIESFFLKLTEYYPEGIQVFDDNIIFAQNFFNVSTANRYYPNSGVSSLGHAIPAAIGARFSEHKPTFAILGDGGFQMCCMEIMTAVNYNLPLTIIMLNNSTMGLIRKNQQQQYQERFINCDFINPDYQYMAKSFGINYQRVTEETGLDDLFSALDCADSINLIEIMIDKNLFPSYTSRR